MSQGFSRVHLFSKVMETSFCYSLLRFTLHVQKYYYSRSPWCFRRQFETERKRDLSVKRGLQCQFSHLSVVCLSGHLFLWPSCEQLQLNASMGQFSSLSLSLVAKAMHVWQTSFVWVHCCLSRLRCHHEQKKSCCEVRSTRNKSRNSTLHSHTRSSVNQPGAHVWGLPAPASPPPPIPRTKRTLPSCHRTVMCFDRNFFHVL